MGNESVEIKRGRKKDGVREGERGLKFYESPSASSAEFWGREGRDPHS